MASPVRSAPAAFGRGFSQLVANPGLVLAPLAFGAVTAAVFVGAGLGAALLLGGLAATRSAAFRRGPEALLDFLQGLQDSVLSSPWTVLLVLLGALLALLLLTALAAWVRAGVTGVLAEADARAGEDAAVGGFRLERPAAAFFRSARERFGAFFALVNLYGLVASFLAAVLMLPLVALLVGAIAQRPGVLAVGGILFLPALPVVVVGGAAARIAYLAAGRAVVVERLDALGATARGIALLRESPGPAVTLYLLTVAGAIAVGLAFVFPRVLLTFAAGAARGGAWAFVGITAFFILLQAAATLAYDAAVTGAFVALWPRPTGTPAEDPAPVPETPA